MPSLSTVADHLSDKLGIDRDAALTLATTYAAQLDHPTVEGGQDPDLEVTDEDAHHIIGAAAAAMETQAPSILDDITDAAQAIASAIENRDDLIRRAIANGVPRTHIARAASLSRERIYQIRDGR